MIPKSSGLSVLVQFAGYRTTLTFLRKDVSLGCAAHLSTKRIIYLFCASKEWRNEQKISVIIHALPPWQDSPLYANVLSGSTLKNSPVSSALYTSRSS